MKRERLRQGIHCEIASLEGAESALDAHRAFALDVHDLLILQIDDQLRLGQPEREQRHQALAAGHWLGIAAA